jgi:hypothetical protein
MGMSGAQLRFHPAAGLHVAAPRVRAEPQDLLAPTTRHRMPTPWSLTK